MRDEQSDDELLYSESEEKLYTISWFVENDEMKPVLVDQKGRYVNNVKFIDYDQPICTDNTTLAQQMIKMTGFWKKPPSEDRFNPLFKEIAYTFNHKEKISNVWKRVLSEKWTFEEDDQEFIPTNISYDISGIFSNEIMYYIQRAGRGSYKWFTVCKAFIPQQKGQGTVFRVFTEELNIPLPRDALVKVSDNVYQYVTSNTYYNLTKDCISVWEALSQCSITIDEKFSRVSLDFFPTWKTGLLKKIPLIIIYIMPEMDRNGSVVYKKYVASFLPLVKEYSIEQLLNAYTKRLYNNLKKTKTKDWLYIQDDLCFERLAEVLSETDKCRKIILQ